MRACCFVVLALALAATTHAAAPDFAYIKGLPLKVAAARGEAQKGWDSPKTADMQAAIYQYNDTLVQIVGELLKRYYPGTPAPAEAANYAQAIYNARRFEQNLANPSGQPLGTEAPLAVSNQVAGELEKTIGKMVEAIVAGHPEFKIALWRKMWTEATTYDQ